MFYFDYSKGKGTKHLMNTTTVFSGFYRRRRQYFLKMLVMTVILLCLMGLHLTIGAKNYSLLQVLQVLLGAEVPGAGYLIWNLRLPRLLAGIFCGIAFGVAGNTFQTLLQNPLASPDIIGVSSGSTVAAVFGILFLHANRGLVSVMAVASGLLTSLLIYKIAYTGTYSKARLILTGIGVQAFFTALINWMVMNAAEYDVPTAMRWMTGNLNGLSTDAIPALCVVVTLTTICIAAYRNSLRGLELGDTYATILGIRVNASRILLIVCAVVLIAAATSVAGPIASVAFLSGPIATKICGKNQTNTISSGLMGAILVLAADFAGQNLLPTRYPVGVITGLLGAPYLLYLLISMNKGE
jgi:iron complex transport system permease protein